MGQDPTSAATERGSETAAILPANTDDPQFRTDVVSGPDGTAEWTGSSALAADVTDPIDGAIATARSPAGLLAVVDSMMQAIGGFISSVMSQLFSHWSH